MKSLNLFHNLPMEYMTFENTVIVETIGLSFTLFIKKQKFLFPCIKLFNKTLRTFLSVL